MKESDAKMIQIKLNSKFIPRKCEIKRENFFFQIFERKFIIIYYFIPAIIRLSVKNETINVKRTK